MLIKLVANIPKYFNCFRLFLLRLLYGSDLHSCNFLILKVTISIENSLKSIFYPLTWKISKSHNSLPVHFQYKVFYYSFFMYFPKVYDNNTFKEKNILSYGNLILVCKIHIIGVCRWVKSQNISFDLNLPHAKFHVFLLLIAHDLHQFTLLSFFKTSFL